MEIQYAKASGSAPAFPEYHLGRRGIIITNYTVDEDEEKEAGEVEDDNDGTLQAETVHRLNPERQDETCS